MRAFVSVAFALTACATSRMEHADTDADDPVDAATAADAAPVTDAAPDAAVATDATTTDAAADATVTCAISTGHTPTLDGVDDLAEYPAAQHVTAGATLAATDDVAVSWDPTYLYVSVTSQAFLDGAKPLHIYLETGDTLSTATPRAGKEYGGVTPQIGFDAGYLIAARRTNDFGSGPYSAVYAPTGTPVWTTHSLDLAPGTSVFTSSDNRTLSVRAPWSSLGGCPLAMRVSVHVVNGAAGNEWKDLIPSTHTPWLTGGGGFYEVSLTGSPAVSTWTLR